MNEPVLVNLGGCNEIPQSGSLGAAIHFLAVLEAASPNQGVSNVGFSRGLSPDLYNRCRLSLCPHTAFLCVRALLVTLPLFLKILFIYLWLCWVFVSVRGLSLVVASGGHSSSRCVGLSLSRPLLLQSTGSRRAGSVTVAHGPSCSAACGIFPDQGTNLCPLHWQADSQPLHHQGSPLPLLIWTQVVLD